MPTPTEPFTSKQLARDLNVGYDDASGFIRFAILRGFVERAGHSSRTPGQKGKAPETYRFATGRGQDMKALLFRGEVTLIERWGLAGPPETAGG